MAQISVLVVDDEPMIRLLIQDMLDDLGHTLAGEAARIDEALKLAKQAEFDVAILDVDLNGQPIWPVAEVLVARGLPFVFATGYGQRGVPEPYRGIPTLGKPFDADALEQAIKAVLSKYSTAVPRPRAFGSEPHRGASLRDRQLSLSKNHVHCRRAGMRRPHDAGFRPEAPLYLSLRYR
jgi:CheY-like chemotaxis protein